MRRIAASSSAQERQVELIRHGDPTTPDEARAALLRYLESDGSDEKLYAASKAGLKILNQEVQRQRADNSKARMLLTAILAEKRGRKLR